MVLPVAPRARRQPALDVLAGDLAHVGGEPGQVGRAALDHHVHGLVRAGQRVTGVRAVQGDAHGEQRVPHHLERALAGCGVGGRFPRGEQAVHERSGPPSTSRVAAG